MKKIGLHVRIQKNIAEAAEKALRLELPFFQNFLVTQHTGHYLQPDDAEKKAFLLVRQQYFEALYIHGSYLINGAYINGFQERLLKQELALAQQLEFTHYVFHPGSTRNCAYHEDGIDNLARTLNTVCRQFPSIKIVLENTAHGSRSIGSDLHDFIVLLEKVDVPEALAFCIDTAHAHAHGYDLQVDQQQPFIDIIQQLGHERIALIHLNDAYHTRGSKIDRHAVIGSGHIGEAALQAFCSNPLLAGIPIVMELPDISEEQERHELERVKKWIL